eukprot:Hpha_TRINITY_DN14073_c0_g1::TRINITY_DN14073_c0_g1_i1::g.44090::m.44090
MYVGAWQEYKLAKAVMTVKSGAARPPSSGSSSFGGSTKSAKSAPVHRRRSSPSSQASQSTAAFTDAADLAARDMSRPRPRPGPLARNSLGRGGRKPKRDTSAGPARAQDTAAHRRKLIQEKIALYTNREPSPRSVEEPQRRLTRPVDPPPTHQSAPAHPHASVPAPAPVAMATPEPPAGLNESVVARLLRAQPRSVMTPAQQQATHPSADHEPLYTPAGFGVSAPPWLSGGLYGRAPPAPLLNATASSARTDGNILSPGGRQDQPPLPPPLQEPYSSEPLSRPAQRTYRDSEETMMLLAHTARRRGQTGADGVSTSRDGSPGPGPGVVYHTDAPPLVRSNSPFLAHSPPKAGRRGPPSWNRSSSPTQLAGSRTFSPAGVSVCSSVGQGEVDALIRWTEGLTVDAQPGVVNVGGSLW